MIEVVTNSETTASIHKKKGVFAAWEDSGFHEFLKEFNPTEQVNFKFLIFIDKFFQN